MQASAARYEVVKKLGSGAFGEVCTRAAASIADLFVVTTPGTTESAQCTPGS